MIHIDYGFHNPQSLIVLVPVVSLIVEKQQVSHLQEKLNTNYAKPEQFRDFLKSREVIQLDRIFKWHALGSLVQMIGLLALSFFFPIALFLTFVPIYEAYYSSKGIVMQRKFSFGAAENPTFELV
jgi:hypothetical protein